MKGKKAWILSLTLAIAFCSLAFAGCGDKDDSSKSSQPNKDWADTDEVNVVYKRKGNTYGLIEPEY